MTSKHRVLAWSQPAAAPLQNTEPDRRPDSGLGQVTFKPSGAMLVPPAPRDHVGHHAIVAPRIRSRTAVSVVETAGHVRSDTLRVQGQPADKHRAVRHLTVDRQQGERADDDAQLADWHAGRSAVHPGQ
ncbi:hypothetical protein ETD86_46540 [Nonomuraea turkmeniaca]|uniref:Uncharacterized protein n=1 Tax=Nonomuraea turkmeniaca TaxID=103838 RepID=A0A5S4EYE8_9ACTN|nr:hypothetical protein [Nonomuraea turkmeniaca]TMR08712.1 hypothetical protein ETD86_46540 [Nonomuraea turkmeniaca]